MMRCITGARFSMNAEVLRWAGIIEDPSLPSGDPEGEWDTYQDPITGEVMNRWTPVDTGGQPITDPNTQTILTIPCLARGVVDGGIRVAGTTERFGDSYENIDYVKMWVPPSVHLSKRDRITNIRSKKNGAIIWMDEENPTPRPTIFNVNGVTPLFDAFNKHVESYVMLERAENYG